MRRFSLLLVAALLALPVNAQDIGAFGNWSVQAGLTNVMTSAVDSAKRGNGRSAPSREAQEYVRDPEVSRKARDVIVELTRKSDPSAVGRLEDVLKENDIIAMFDRDMQPFDLSSNNLADVFAAFILTNWMIANKADIPQPDHVAAVRNNISNGMGAAIVRLQPAQRQLIAEVLVYQTMFSIGARTDALNEPAKMTALSDQAHRTLLGMGVDARSFKLDGNGLSPR